MYGELQFKPPTISLGKQVLHMYGFYNTKLPRAGSQYDFPGLKILKIPLIPVALPFVFVPRSERPEVGKIDGHRKTMHSHYVIDKYVDPVCSDDSINVNTVCSTRSVRDQHAREVEVDYHN